MASRSDLAKVRSGTFLKYQTDLRASNAQRDQLWAILHAAGASGANFDLLRQIYRDSVGMVETDGERSFFDTEKGVLQGDSPSPILWAIYFGDLRFPPTRCDPFLAGLPVPFLTIADDLSIYALSPPRVRLIRDRIEVMRQDAQQKLALMQEYASSKGLTLSSKKTYTMLISASWKVPLDAVTSLHLNDEEIEGKLEARHLGLFYQHDHSFSYSKEVDYRAGATLAIASTLVRYQQWYGALAATDARIFYISKVQQQLLQNAAVSFYASPSVVADVQARVLRWLLGCHDRTPILPILMDMAIVPIQALRVAKAVQMYEKAASKSANLVTRYVQSSCPCPPSRVPGTRCSA
jgi:hypothetical protein